NFLHLVRNTSFYPPPKVDSAILELKLKPPPVKAPYDPLFELIRAAFQMRRKMLRSSLKAFAPSSNIEKALETLGLSPTARPQELSLENFSALFFALNSINSEKDE
ncbi:MAG: hypothetical protein KDK76_00580, partial [Chlamydiia bacterium]|nr:hypothetical protein [Chlamydiia bacterium]